jgi:predicted AAA+ superfamily ATPase
VVERREQQAQVTALLRRNPVVAILGARQVGKTTLAQQVARARKGPVTWFDLESPEDVARLAEPMLALSDLRGLVVLDEIQRRPDLFPVLRVLADRRRSTTRFLVLGSASPDLLRQSSESLAGRIAYHDLLGFDLGEVGAENLDRLWLRGSFPRAYLAPSNRASLEWRRDFIRTFLERDLPQLGIRIPAETIRRFWSMLAHYHGQVWNASEFARSFGVNDTTVRRYLDLLCSTYVVRLLIPFHASLGKRQVKSPKIYLADSGLLHQLLGLKDRRDVEGHPKLGASWEGFALDQVTVRLKARREECHFWATHTGAELDLLVLRGRRRAGFEFKRTSSPKVTRSMRIAREDLELDEVVLIHAGRESFPLEPGIRAVSLHRILDDLKPLR